MALLCTVCSAIFALLGYIGLSLIKTLKEIKTELQSIKVTASILSVSYNEFKEEIKKRVEKLENKVFD